ncbi:MAG TPA: response regulator [Burkholderiales bacterium]|nr:response regulator [Burkholderiales bacterium]
MQIDDELLLLAWSARPDLSCDYVSPAWLAFTGFSAAQALGHGWSRAVHAEDLARWLDTCVRAFDARQPFALEYRLRRHDGQYRWMLDRAVPRRQKGAFAGFTGVCVDIDDAKRAQQELARGLERERRHRLANEAASRARDAFVTATLNELQLLSGVRVLVVEDDPGARELLVRLLRVAGAETRTAASCAEALPALEAWRPDLVLSDLGMHGGDGYRLIRALRSLPAERGGGVRAAALTTAAAEPATRHRAAAAGYDAQLAKPVEPLALLATVARLVQPAHHP